MVICNDVHYLALLKILIQSTDFLTFVFVTERIHLYAHSFASGHVPIHDWIWTLFLFLE